jgi:hypothetical protein
VAARFPPIVVLPLPVVDVPPVVPEVAVPAPAPPALPPVVLSPTGTRELRLDRRVVPPGSLVNLSGSGCDPSVPVVGYVGGQRAFSVTADTGGSFTARFKLPDLDVGRYPVMVTCGPVITETLDIILVVGADPGSWTLAVLVFFALLALAAVRRSIKDARVAFRP